MGNKNFSMCCGNEVKFIEEKEKKFEIVSSLRSETFVAPNIIKENEVLIHFAFCYENIMKYLITPYILNYGEHNETVKSMQKFEITQEEFHNAENYIPSKTYFVIQKNLEHRLSKKYLVKVIKLNYETNNINQQDGKNKIYPLQYYVEKNILKELRIFRNHKNSFIIKCNGYHIEKQNIFFIYNHHEQSLEYFIKKRALDFQNKIRITKSLIELIKSLHTEGIISLELSVKNIRFTSKHFQLKLISFLNSLDMGSLYDIDRSSTVERDNLEIHHPPEIFINNIEHINWYCDIWSMGIIMSMLFSDKIHEISSAQLIEYYKNQKVPEVFYNTINENVHIKSMIVGLLRTSPLERPCIFEIIDIYNLLIKDLQYTDDYLISVNKEEVIKFTEFFKKSTYIIFNNELNDKNIIIEAHKIDDGKGKNRINNN